LLKLKQEAPRLVILEEFGNLFANNNNKSSSSSIILIIVIIFFFWRWR